MERFDLDKIITEIKKRGLTAYQISKDTPLGEDGINKILSGTSKKPRKSTLLILHEYLFGKENVSDLKVVRNEEGSTVDNQIAQKVKIVLQPIMEGMTNDIIREIKKMDIELARLRSVQEDLKKVQGETHKNVQAIERKL